LEHEEKGRELFEHGLQGTGGTGRKGCGA